jgi:DNA replication and repair protein RecF
LRVQHIHIQNFRKHGDASLDLQNGVNVIYGRNGVGKTNFLEAIHYACLTKSLINASDAECLRFGAPHFEIDTTFESDSNLTTSVRVYYSADEGKNIFINRSPLVSFSEIIGQYPCVSLSPFDIALAQGAPAERRRFLDVSISQTNKAYLSDLLNYKRILSQRNKILSELKFASNEAMMDSLAVWTESFAHTSAAIIARRLAFTEGFAEYITKAYHRFQSFSETPSMVYESDLNLGAAKTKDEILGIIEEKLRRVESDELRRGQTLLGPHRDDVEFLINGISLKKFASQGQQKTFVICLKLAQHAYISEVLNEKPVFLLDDVFSELDRSRAGDLIDLLKPLGQSVITTTERKDFDAITQHEISV